MELSFSFGTVKMVGTNNMKRGAEGITVGNLWQFTQGRQQPEHIG